MGTTPRLKLGDIVEIRTSKGFAYAQYVNFHDRPPRYGTLMRVLPGIFPQRLKDFEQLVLEDGSYCCFWWAPRDLAERKIRLAANVPVPKEFRKMPMFKWGISSLFTGHVRQWSIWNGKTRGSKPVAHLTELQKRYPIKQIVSLEIVKYRIESGWRPEDACAEPPDPGRPLLDPSHLKSLKANAAKVRIKSVSLFKNDATWDAFGDMERDGLAYIRKAVADIKKMALRDDLDREPANTVLAIAAVCLARHGIVLREARQQGMNDDVLAACRGEFSQKLLTDLAWLVERVRTQSEVRDLWEQEGLLGEWFRKVRALLKRLKSISGNKRYRRGYTKSE
jgi:hypothetical protein